MLTNAEADKGAIHCLRLRRKLLLDSFAAFCEAAPRVKCKRTLAVDSSSIVRASIEMLLSLLFALDGETEVSAHLGVRWTGGAN